MATCTIKGKEYKLGDIAGTKENFGVIGALMALGENSNFEVIWPEVLRVIEESITAGEGKKSAAKAMADLKVKLGPGSDFMNAVDALVKSVVE